MHYFIFYIPIGIYSKRYYTMKKTLKEHINKINKMISRTNHPAVERNWRRKLDDSPLLKEIP